MIKPTSDRKARKIQAISKMEVPAYGQKDIVSNSNKRGVDTSLDSDFSCASSNDYAGGNAEHDDKTSRGRCFHESNENFEEDCLTKRRGKRSTTKADSPLGSQWLTSNSQVYFPTGLTWQNRQCSKLDVPLKRAVTIRLPPSPFVLSDQVPAEVYPVAGDGNCLFRCLSLLITGTERLHKLIRTNVVRHMCLHQKSFSALMPRWSHDDVTRYIDKSKMYLCGTWGSDIEILAAAHLLKTRIYVYTRCGSSWQWALHDMRLTSPRSHPVKESIYLIHEGQVHYDVVERIAHKDVVKTQQVVPRRPRKRKTSPQVFIDSCDCHRCR